MDDEITSEIRDNILKCSRIVSTSTIKSEGNIIPEGIHGTIITQEIKHGHQVEAQVQFDGFPRPIKTKIKHIRCER